MTGVEAGFRLMEQVRKEGTFFPRLHLTRCSSAEEALVALIRYASMKPFSDMSDPPHNDKEIGDDLPLSMFLKRNKRHSQKRMSQLDFGTEKASHPSGREEHISVGASHCTDNQQLGSRKRVRVIISDDEDSGNDERGCSREKAHNHVTSDIATSQVVRSSPIDASQDRKASSQPDAQKDNHSVCESFHLEASSSYRSDNRQSNSGNKIRCKEIGAWKTTSNIHFASKGSTSRNTLLDQGQFDPSNGNACPFHMLASQWIQSRMTRLTNDNRISCFQSQLTEFRSYEGQEMNTGEKILPLKLDLHVNNTVIRDQLLWDINNFESDPEEFARTFCKELDIGDPEAGPAIAVAIRQQLYEHLLN